AVRARISDYIAYVHFLVLYYEYSIGQRMKQCEILDNTTSGTPDALIQYMWRINDRDMVQAYYMMQRIIAPPAGSELAAHPDLALRWPATGVGAAWNTIKPVIDDAKLSELLACDLTAPPDPTCNTTPGGSPVCNTNCPCPDGQGTCLSDADCGPGEVCGQNNGSFFDLQRSQRVCWPIGCYANFVLSDCGTPSAPCGPNCWAALPCSKDADCAAGEVCGHNNASRFDAPSGIANVCWPALCATAAASNCGNLLSTCGSCACTPDCSHAACGNSSDD